MLLHMYHIFSTLRGHLHFSVQFSLHFHGNLFLDDPLLVYTSIYLNIKSVNIVKVSKETPFLF